MDPLQALYRLQTLETSIDEAKRRVEEIEALLRNDETIAGQRASYKQAESDLSSAEGQVRDLELEIASIDEKMAEGEQLLYSGQIKNPKEMQDRQDEIESLKRRRAMREEQLTSGRDTLASAQSTHESAEAELKSAETAQQTQNQDLFAEQEQLRSQMQKWLFERKTTLKSVTQEHHKVYKKLKSRRNGIAVARLGEDDICTACRVQQTQMIVHQVRQASELVMCINCGRILIEA